MKLEEKEKERIREIIADHRCVEVGEIKDSNDLIDKFCMDKIDLSMIMVKIEDEFDICFGAEAFEKFKTTQDLFDLIEKKK